MLAFAALGPCRENGINVKLKSYPVRANWLLAIGALTGISLAASGILEPAPERLPSEAVARVGDSLVSKQEYLAYLDLLAQDKRNPLTDTDQRHVLDRMIDEKLLLARGLDLGLPQSSPRVRKIIVQQVMQSVLAEVASQTIDDDELATFYTESKAYFAHPPRTQVRRYMFRERDGQSALELASLAREALLAGDAPEGVIARYGAPDLLPVPGDALPDHKLLQYLGPTLTAKAQAMDSGSISEPLQVGRDTLLLQVLYKKSMEYRDFDEVKDRVAVEYERRRGDEALAEYLDSLRGQTDILVDDAFLQRIGRATPAGQ